MSSRVVSLQWTMTYLWLLFLRVGIADTKSAGRLLPVFIFIFAAFLSVVSFFTKFMAGKVCLCGVSMTLDKLQCVGFSRKEKVCTELVLN